MTHAIGEIVLFGVALLGGLVLYLALVYWWVLRAPHSTLPRGGRPGI